MKTVNLGIVAHVDAGKTSLTERLLYAAGVIDRLGSVDDGTTQTDSLALERQRGITIRSAVASFPVGDITVNLIDTPGHPDFIAEVERALAVLDGAVLVVSAVEGVQAQTRVLMRTLHRLGIPTLIFVNKIDRTGARYHEVLRGMSRRLTPATVAMGSVSHLGARPARFHPYGADDPGFTSRLTEVLADHDDTLLAAFVADGAVPYPRLRDALTAQSRRGRVHPVFFGSAATGAGVAELTAALPELLPAHDADADGPASGTVFKVERGLAGDKIAYVRMFSGTVRIRDRVRYGADRAGKVTAVRVFEHGGAVPATSLAAGRIGTLRGLADVRIGDPVGQRRDAGAERHFAPPTLQTVVAPCRAEDRRALHTALTQLAEQDPLIDLRQDPARRQTLLSLYGEVQKEVIGQTLADEYGIEVEFGETVTLCVERPAGSGSAFDVLHTEPNPFLATVGLRVDPGPVGSGVDFRLEVELGSMPFAFFTAVEEAVRDTLRQGLYGWEVVDCVVTMTRSGYLARQSHSGGTFDKSMSSTAGDFRNLTPLVLMAALRRAGTRVCEPVHRFRLEFPADALGPVVSMLSRSGAVVGAPVVRDGECLLEGEVPAAQVHPVRRRLPSLTRGEAVLESVFASYRPVSGVPPSRPRTDHNPLDREEYLLHVVRRV